MISPYILALHLGALELELAGFHELAAAVRQVIRKEINHHALPNH